MSDFKPRLSFIKRKYLFRTHASCFKYRGVLYCCGWFGCYILGL